MELRRITICMAVFVLAVISHCSDAHTLHRRAVEDVNYDDEGLQQDQADYEAQKDADGGNDADEEEVEDGIILTKPEHYQVNVGQTVRLECKVTPAEGTVVTWAKDNQEYFLGNSKLNGPDRVMLADNSKDLLIRDVQPSDSGSYKCEIMQDKAASIEHTVMVRESPRIIKFEASKGGKIVEGDDLLLTCDVAGSPKPEIVWSRTLPNADNQKLTEKDGEFSGNTFFAKNVRPDISGKYYCYAINTVGNSVEEILVTVSGKPRVHVPRTIVNTDINVQALLQCSAHEHPLPQIRWYKDGRLIQESSAQFQISTLGTRSNLTVTPQSDEDFGVFTCEAENVHGKHDRSIDLVQSPVVENLDSEGPKLTWTVNSHQPLEQMEVQLRSLGGDGWTTINVPVPQGGEHKHQFEVIYVVEDKGLEAGKYEATVKVKNEKSWSKHSDPTIIEIETQAEPIQTASIHRGDNNFAHSIRPTSTALLSTILMYLLVRML